jgi:membrane-associated phospholipid phosphatase
MQELHYAELSIIKNLQSLRTPWLDHFFLTYNIFDQDYLYVMIIIIVWNFINERAGFHLLYLMVIAALLYTYLKIHLAFPRPYDLDASIKILGTIGYGFPSGAATEACLTFGFILLWMKPRHHLATLGLITIVLIVGLTRVYLGAHFPSDIIGGFALALMMLSGYAYFIYPIEHYLHKQSRFAQLVLHGLFLTCLLCLSLSYNSLHLLSLLWGTVVYHVHFNQNNKTPPLSEAIGALCVALIGLGSGAFLLKQLPAHVPWSFFAHTVIFFMLGLWLGYSKVCARKILGFLNNNL